MDVPQLENPLAVFCALAAVCGFIFWLAGSKRLASLFRYLPPLLLLVFLPSTLSAIGLLPRASPAYDALRDYALPLGILLMVMTTDIPKVLRVGPLALAVMLCGTLGVIAGAFLAFALVHGALPPESWKMFAAITASWTGGGANFAAVQNAVAMPAALVGPAIVVDATLGFLWLAVVLLGASYQHVLLRFYQPRATLQDAPAQEAADARSPRATRIDYPELLIVLGVGLPIAALAMAAGRLMWAWVGDDPDGALAMVLGEYALGILCVTAVGIALSFTRLRGLEATGGPEIGYAAQFLFFASLGAQADFSAIVAMPLLVLAGIGWIAVHAIVLLLGARALRAPASLIAVSSIANIGGPSTAAIVGAQYGKAWSSLGVLLGLFGSLIGTLAGLICGYFLAQIAA